ncbi:N-acetyltransferase ats1 [Lecanosticta acicola]|uniref:N-acetyltransferase ats1 n=1 Tax=Lecanosticta acicola TaxID=111012 RepID=A0AAI9EDF8_9PEZI|nr:N-acetyltransferase ats1 [Lecanosticta acicola]
MSQANKDAPTITPATVEDVPEIFAMIKELADYENEPAKVQATEDSIRRTLTFAPCARAQHTNPGYARCFVLRTPTEPSDAYKAKYPPTADEKPGAVAGMAVYFNNYSTWRSKPGIYLEDLFVRPQYRKRGYGKMLIQTLAQEVVRIDGGRLEWSCLKWNEPSLAFYKSLGAKRMDDWVQLRVDGEALNKLAGAPGH